MGGPWAKNFDLFQIGGWGEGHFKKTTFSKSPKFTVTRLHRDGLSSSEGMPAEPKVSEELGAMDRTFPKIWDDFIQVVKNGSRLKLPGPNGSRSSQQSGSGRELHRNLGSARA